VLFAVTDMPDDHWVWTTLALLSVPALIALNGFFVAAEFALVSVRRTRVEELVNQGVPRAKAVAAAIDQLDRTIAATQLGITLASIGLGWVGEPALARLVGPLFGFLPASWHAVAAHSLATALAFVLITFLHVVLGELIPKTITLQIPDTVALTVAKPLLIFCRVSRPFVLLMNVTGNFLIRRLGFEPRGEAGAHSVEELQLLIEDTEEAGIIDEDQADFVQNVFALSDKQVSDCMVPRERVAALELSAPPDKVLEAVRNGAHTRMPVYEGDLDHVVGIVNTKDLFYLFSLKGIVVLEDAIYPPTFLEPTESVANALRLLRKSRKPMALVRDEAGHILGMITLEDVLEEIVGDIEDEHDRPLRKLPRRRRKVKAGDGTGGLRNEAAPGRAFSPEGARWNSPGQRPGTTAPPTTKP
jgi:putative hemolysin